MKRTYRLLICTAVLSGGCLMEGCTGRSSAFTPEQITSIRALAQTASEAARENNVIIVGHVSLRLPRFGLKQEAYADGLEADLTIVANPAAENARRPAVTVPPAGGAGSAEPPQLIDG